MSCKHCWVFISVHMEELDLEEKYYASNFNFRTLDLVPVLFEEVLSMFEKKKETALHA